MTLNLENYTFDEDSNGNLIIVDSSDNTVLTYDDTPGEWLLGDTVNANGQNIDSIGQLGDASTGDVYDGADLTAPVNNSSVDTDDIGINNYSRHHTYQLGQDQQGRIYATDAKGQLVAGGPDALNVSDPVDTGEILEYLVNDLSDNPPVIGLGGRFQSDARTDYYFKTTANLTRLCNIHGNGRGMPMLGPHSNADLTTCIDITPGSTGRSLMEWSYMKCSGLSGAFGNADHFLTTDGVREINFFSMEVRDFDSNPVLLQNVEIDWNCMVNVWFLNNGDGPKITNSNEWRFIGCSFRDSPNAIVLDNVTGVTRAGNYVGSGDWAMLNGSTFNPRTEEFATINSINERPGIDRLKYKHHAQIDTLEFVQHGWNSDFTTKTEVGSGTVNFANGNTRDTLSTGSTNDSVAQATVNSYRFSSPSLSLGGSPLAFSAGLSGDLDVANRVMMVAGDAGGSNYVGIVFEGDAVKAAACTGGVETLQTLESPVGSTSAPYSCVFEDPTLEVYRSGDTLVGSHTFADSETPSGAGGSDAFFSVRIENASSGGNNRSLDTKMPKFTQVPPT